MMRMDVVSVGMLVGYGLDAMLGDPRRWHPVAGFGRVASMAERVMYRPTRVRGTIVQVLLIGMALALGLLLAQFTGASAVLITALVTWTVLGGRSLRVEANAMQSLLLENDLDGARHRIRNLVGRDPSVLDAQQLARACVESVAENGADAVVSPLFWGAVAGVPGLLVYRAANTLDAMFGHRTPRLRDFGWAAARFDDLLNWLPARATVLITAVAGGSLRGVVRVFRVVGRDAAAHPSPNAGPVEAAFAAALDRQLGGRNVYAGEAEERGLLGDGPQVQVPDIASAVRLQRRIGMLALLFALAVRHVMQAVL